MRIKQGIDVIAAIFPTRHGGQKARKLGFSPGEFNLLWWLAEHPDHVRTKFDEDQKTKILEAISRQPLGAGQLIQFIRSKKRIADNVIRAVFLDRKANPPNWTLSNDEVAHIVCKKINQPKLSGPALDRLIENVKKHRQELVKKFPLKKGKT